MATTNFANTDWNSNGTSIVSYNPTGVHQYDLVAKNTVPGKRTNANFNLNYRYGMPPVVKLILMAITVYSGTRAAAFESLIL